MAVQRGNVQCVRGAYGEPAFEELDEIFYIVKPNSIFQMLIFDLLNMNKNTTPFSIHSTQNEGLYHFLFL